jgi:DNA-directed RNA polymerase specialized sigma subunit
VPLSENVREIFGGLTYRGKHKSQKIINSLILLACDDGEFQKKRSTNKEIARILNISMKKIDRIKSGLLNKVLVSP